MTQTVILRGPEQRALAKRLVDAAPADSVVKIGPAKRSTEQNDKMWAMLSDVSRARPEGRKHTPEVWKALFMSACGHAVQFEEGLDGYPFPVGFRSSRLNKAQMSDLIEFIYAYGSQHGVVWSEPVEIPERA
jgi:hypothetical protein